MINLTNTYEIKIQKRNGATERNLKKLQSRFEYIQELIEDYSMIDEYKFKKLTKDCIRATQNEIENKIKSMVSLGWITSNLKKEEKIKKDIFAGFTFECEKRGIKVYSKGDSNEAFVSFNEGTPMLYPFSTLEELKKEAV